MDKRADQEEGWGPSLKRGEEGENDPRFSGFLRADTS